MVEDKAILTAGLAEVDVSLLQVNSLLLPVAEAVLLVPQLAVAEVLGVGEINAEALCLDKLNANPHCYGWFNWRDQHIPLLSYTSIYTGHRPSLDKNLKVVICNAVFEAAATGFYALLVSGFPRAVRLSMAAEMLLEGSPCERQGVQMLVNIDGEEVLIPDFDFLEQVVCEVVKAKG